MNKMHEIPSSYRMVDTHNTHLNTSKLSSPLFFERKKLNIYILHSRYVYNIREKLKLYNSNNCYRTPKTDEWLEKLEPKTKPYETTKRTGSSFRVQSMREYWSADCTFHYIYTRLLVIIIIILFLSFCPFVFHAFCIERICRLSFTVYRANIKHFLFCCVETYQKIKIK